MLPAVSLVVALAILSLLIVIAVYDLEHTIIPDEWVWSFNALALLAALSFGLQGDSIAIAVVAGPIVAAPLGFLWLISRGRWMGFGDVKLALGMGWLLGIEAGLQALVAAFVVGALFSVCILLPLPWIIRTLRISRFGRGHQTFTMKSEIAFGPFLILATLAVWILGMYGIAVPIIQL